MGLELLFAGLLGVAVGALAASACLLWLLRARADRDLVERRLQLCADLDEAFRSLGRHAGGELDSAILSQARESVRQLARQLLLSSWLLRPRARARLEALAVSLRAWEEAVAAGRWGLGRAAQALSEGCVEGQRIVRRMAREEGAEHRRLRLLSPSLLEDFAEDLATTTTAARGGPLPPVERPQVRRDEGGDGAQGRGDGPRPDGGEAGGAARRGTPGRAALILLVSLVLAWASPGPGAGARVAQAQEPGSGARDELSVEELEARRRALDSWAFEPVALSSSELRVRMDRRDGSFVIEDHRTRVRWFSSWGRRGFAAVEVGEGPARHRVAVDRVEKLVAEERRIAFVGGSSAEPIPDVRFELEMDESGRFLTLRAVVPEPSRSAVRSVRLLDEALWIPDSAAGGWALPIGMGVWIDARGERATTRRWSPAGTSAEAVSEIESASMAACGAIQDENPLLLLPSSPASVLTLSRRPVDAPGFPGRTGTFLSLDLPAEGGSVDLYILGKAQTGVFDATRAYRDRLGAAWAASTLRNKTGQRPELRPFLGAAVFRLEARGDGAFAKAAKFAARLRRELEVDEALILLRGWSEGGVLGASPLLPARAAAGGDGGLSEAFDIIRAQGLLVGLEVDVRCPAPVARSAEGEAWAPLLEAADAEGGLPSLAALCSPQAMAFHLVPSEPPAGAGPLATAAPAGAGVARRALARRAEELFGLAILDRFDDTALSFAAGLDGLPGGLPVLAAPQEAWPWFPSVHGQCARLLGPVEQALGPGDAVRALEHLLIGEVPVYQAADDFASGRGLPADSQRAAAAGPGGVFAREEGWAAGRGLSPQEVFIKNTYEVLSHVARLRAREPLGFHRALTSDGLVRESYFGLDLRIVANLGESPYHDEAEGCVLPPLGFLVRHPFLHAFYALEIHGVRYERPALFVLRSLEGKMILRAEQVKIFHGLGPSHLRFGGRDLTVEREVVTKIW